MFETLFGAGMPLAVRFFVAFLIVLGLIGATAWAVRRFGSGRLGGASARGRQPRLAVIDYATVDARRRLILVRRDNVEHLVMIGGPTDVVVEPNIVRAAAAPREMTRPPAVEALPRAIALPDSGNGAWPLAPEPTTATNPPPLRAHRAEPPSEEPAGWPLQPHPETPTPRPQRDTLAALADELSTRPTPPPRPRPQAPMRVQPLDARLDSRAAARAEPRVEPRPETRAEPRPEPAPPAPQPAPAPAPAMDASADQSLAEMAQRLEAALRKPATQAAPAEPPPRAARPAEPKPAARPESKPNQNTTLYDNLEQEMASLLGRPTSKS